MAICEVQPNYGNYSYMNYGYGNESLMGMGEGINPYYQWVGFSNLSVMPVQYRYFC
jgi:hypothetical protein